MSDWLISSPVWLILFLKWIFNLLAVSDAAAEIWDPRPRTPAVLLVGDPLYVTGLVS